MFGSARLEKSDESASPYEEELKDKFITAYNGAKYREEKKLRRRMNELEFGKFNVRFAARWDSKYMTKFKQCVNTDYSGTRDRITAFDFTGRRIL